MARYIDAEELKKDYLCNIAERPLHGNMKVNLATVRGWIDSQPTADVAPVAHAHWVDVTPNAVAYGRRYKCSRCGRGVAIVPMDYEKGVNILYPYCHCGALMDKEVER